MTSEEMQWILKDLSLQCECHITLIFEDAASTKCLGRQERFRSPMPLFKSLQLFTDTAGKGPVVSPASLQEPLAAE